MKKFIATSLIIATLATGGHSVIRGNKHVAKTTQSTVMSGAKILLQADELPIGENFVMVMGDEVAGDRAPAEPKKDFIKWMEFNASSSMISACQRAHVKLIEIGVTDIGAVDLLAYLAIKNGNNFGGGDRAKLDKVVAEIKSGNRSNIDKYRDNKYYNRYKEQMHAVLDGIINPDTAEVSGYHPVAQGHWYNDCDDFGNSRSYGFKRRHLGHDMFGSVGAPIIAMEGGVITEMGWNQYGGWRVGIKSHCGTRYYYYAHLRKKNPFADGLGKGMKIEAGQVVGYLGNTGYSHKEGTDMKSTKPHLHFGMQIIFDESQEDGNGEIWVDVYQIVKFLQSRRVKI